MDTKNQYNNTHENYVKVDFIIFTKKLHNLLIKIYTKEVIFMVLFFNFHDLKNVLRKLVLGKC